MLTKFFQKTHYFWIITRILYLILFAVSISQAANITKADLVVKAFFTLYLLAIVVLTILEQLKRKEPKWMQWFVGTVSIFFAVLLIYLLLFYVSQNFIILAFAFTFWMVLYGTWEISKTFKTTSKKQKLIILSDLWGKEKSDWIDFYIENLKGEYEISYYDCRELAQIDQTIDTEEALHQQFVNGGIQTAITQLILKEQEMVTVLGFSVGGSIGWKATLQGLKVDRLFAVSSTRIRYETEKPAAEIKLYYGENDAFKPASEWHEKLETKVHIFPDESHSLYVKKEMALAICHDIKNTKISF